MASMVSKNKVTFKAVQDTFIMTIPMGCNLSNPIHSNVVMINFENTTLKRQLAARARVEVDHVQDPHLTDAELADLQITVERQRARAHHSDSDTEHKEEAKK